MIDNRLTTPVERAQTSGQETLVHRVMFSPLTPIASEKLYVDVEGTVLNLSRTTLTIDAYSTASTRTYFGRFAAAYYQRWTNVRLLTIRAKASGAGRIRVFASDDIDRERTVGSAEIDGSESGIVEVPVRLDRFLDGGFVWVDIEAGSEPVTVADLQFWTNAEPKARTHDVVVCTHNRAAECLATLDSFSSDELVTSTTRQIYVIDQGAERVSDHPDFPRVSEALGTKLVYLQQANLGGAGGFTRGLYESLSGGSEGIDVVLMDDDVVLEPESILRLTTFARFTLQPVIVGAQMLYLYHPNTLHTAAEDADLSKLRAGVPVNAEEHELDLTEELPYRWAEGGYNAWWTCLVPAEVVRTIGYPLPMFFQWDDIEFGLRARANGIPTVTLTGAAVWHADFSLKDRDDWSRFFSTRNSLIVAALHSDAVPRGAVTALTRDITQLMLSMQYGLVATMLAGVDAFLRGPSTVQDGGQRAVAEIRTLRALYPDTVRHPPEEIVEKGLFSLPAVANPGPPRIPSLVVAKRLAYQVLGVNRREAKVASADNSWHHSSLFAEAIVTDAALDAFRIRRYERATAGRLAKEAAETLFRLSRSGRRVSRAWRRALPQLSDRATWSRLFEI